MHNLDMIVDFQYGSTGKGLIAGYLAKRGDYDTVTCSFATNAGHTYRDGELTVMTQQLPTGIISPTVKNVMIGPGSLIHVATLEKEIEKYAHFLEGKRLVIHPQAAVVEDYHAATEVNQGQTKMGSTAKGVGAAMIERIRRNVVDPNTASVRIMRTSLAKYLVTAAQYRSLMAESESCLCEGAQGFSLSLYHGAYPYVTSRDVTPWQIAADCGLPMKWASNINVVGTLRTYPIRVSNRDGSSGPPYPDQQELSWESIGVAPELTTVTKLPRRLFSFSHQQYQEALWHCGSYWKTRLFLNFANYMPPGELLPLIQQIESVNSPLNMNHAQVAWIGWGPDDSDVKPYPGPQSSASPTDNPHPKLEDVTGITQWLRGARAADADSEGGHVD